VRKKESVKKNQMKCRIVNNANLLWAKLWPKLTEGELVFVKTEVNRKKDETLFGKLAEVIEVRELDTYLLRDKKNKLFKSHV
jgi:hypothetical protein